MITFKLVELILLLLFKKFIYLMQPTSWPTWPACGISRPHIKTESIYR